MMFGVVHASVCFFPSAHQSFRVTTCQSFRASEPALNTKNTRQDDAIHAIAQPLTKNTHTLCVWCGRTKRTAKTPRTLGFACCVSLAPVSCRRPSVWPHSVGSVLRSSPITRPTQHPIAVLRNPYGTPTPSTSCMCVCLCVCHFRSTWSRPRMVLVHIGHTESS